MRKLPPLNALKAFEACARLRSFTLAAEELFVSQSAVSKQVKLLEDHLGIRLLYRQPRKLELTREGNALRDELTEIFDRMALVAAEVEKQRSTLRLKAPPTFSVRWLLPRLSEFDVSEPDINVRLSNTWQPVNFAEEDFDAGVVCSSRLSAYDHTVSKNLIVEEDITPACSPKLLNNGTEVGQPADLLDFSLIHSRPDWDVWREWFISQGVSYGSEDPQSQQYFEAMDTAIHAAVQGMGIALVNPDFVADEIAMGRLILPFPQSVCRLSGYHLVYPKLLAGQQRILRFQRWLSKAAGASDDSPKDTVRHEHRYDA